MAALRYPLAYLLPLLAFVANSIHLGRPAGDLKIEKAKRTKRRCAICAADKNIDCHHLVYRNLHDVLTSDLRWLCRRCHSLAHQLMKNGTIRFKPGATHHSLFVVTKTGVKKHLGIARKNLFWPAG